MAMDKLLARGQLFLLVLAALYVALLGLLTVPYFQRHAIFFHAVRWPLRAEFDNPVKYGLPASRSLNVQVETGDKLRLGAWLILPPSESKKTSLFDGPPSEAEISESLSESPTVLFFHGNAATRAIPLRVLHCSKFATRFRANVLAIDYRGFGDSEGDPSEEGLITDARAAWDWVVSRGAKPENILLVGLSLGTGVVSGFAAELAKEDVRPRGIVLLSPFRSIKSLLPEYRLFSAIPVLQPLEFFPPLQELFAKFLVTKFNTSETLPTIKATILLAHSKDDFDVPHAHSRTLFESFLEELLPPAPSLPSSHSDMKTFDWIAFKTASDERLARKLALVDRQEIPGFAIVHRLNRTSDSGEVIFVEASYGGHNRIGTQDSLIDLLQFTFF
ncbi:hypothetical protein ACEPAG_1761 [Sanghuangporus baumii]